jgi:hypothetical protein
MSSISGLENNNAGKTQKQNQNMGKIKNIILAAVFATFAVGCASNTKSLGTIGNTQFFRVKSSTFAGPNFSALVSKNICEETPKVEQVFGGPGLGPTTISAIGQVGAAAVLGTSFPKIPKNVGDNINVSGGNSNGGSAQSDSSSSATGGSASSAGGTKTHPDSPGNGGVPGNGGQNKP